MKPNRARACFLTAVLMTFGSLIGGVDAAVLLTLEESGGQITATLTGSFNLDAVGEFEQDFNPTNNLTPSVGAFGIGFSDSVSRPDQYLFDVGLSTLTPFGSGGFLGEASALGGNHFTLTSNSIMVPDGYVSGDALFATRNYSGTFSSRGLVLGEFTSTIVSPTASENITVQVIPEPSIPILSIFGLFLALNRRRFH